MQFVNTVETPPEIAEIAEPPEIEGFGAERFSEVDGFSMGWAAVIVEVWPGLVITGPAGAVGCRVRPMAEVIGRLAGSILSSEIKIK